MSEPAIPLSPTEERNLRRLKLVVIILGVMIVLGLIGLVVGIIWKASSPKVSPSLATEASAVGPATGGGARARLPIPQGANLVDMDLDGNRILLRLRSVAGEEELIIYDAAKNQVVSRVVLEPTP
jgi:hypothetical protein